MTTWVSHVYPAGYCVPVKALLIMGGDMDVAARRVCMDAVDVVLHDV